MENKILNKRYNTISKIGSGGMAFVYKGKDTLLNRIVAIKVLKNELQEGDEFINRFEIEAKSIAALSHPNIVSIYDMGNEENIHYFIMEYVDGESLKEKIDREKCLKWEDMYELVLSVCEGLKHAHKNGIIHRDIKPHNILIDKENTPKIADFGIAKYAMQKTMTKTGRIMGSVYYISPEQAKGQKADIRSDIYSLGITLYEMFTGKLPFEGENPISVIVKHIKEEPKKIYDINSKIPKEISKIIMKMLTKDPQRRYQNIDEVILDFKNYIKNGYSKSDIFIKTQNFKDIFKLKKNISQKQKNSNNEENINSIDEKVTNKPNENKKDIKEEKDLNKNIINVSIKHNEEVDNTEKKLKSGNKIVAITFVLVFVAFAIFIYNFLSNDDLNNDNLSINNENLKVEKADNTSEIPEESDTSEENDNNETENIDETSESKEKEEIEETEEAKEMSSKDYDKNYFDTFFNSYYSTLSKAIENKEFSIVEGFYVPESEHYYEQKTKIAEYTKNYTKLECVSCNANNITKIDEETYIASISVSFNMTTNNGTVSPSSGTYNYTVNRIGDSFKISKMD